MFKKIIKEICDEENINYSVISKDWIIVLEKNGKVNLITGYKFGINNHALGELLDDKYATFELLSKKNIPVIEHSILYGPTNNNPYAVGSKGRECVEELFEKYNKNVVLKINDGTCGINVWHIKNKEELNYLLERTEKLFDSIFNELNKYADEEERKLKELKTKQKKQEKRMDEIETKMEYLDENMDNIKLVKKNI